MLVHSGVFSRSGDPSESAWHLSHDWRRRNGLEGHCYQCSGPGGQKSKQWVWSFIQHPECPVLIHTLPWLISVQETFKLELYLELAKRYDIVERKSFIIRYKFKWNYAELFGIRCPTSLNLKLWIWYYCNVHAKLSNFRRT